MTPATQNRNVRPVVDRRDTAVSFEGRRLRTGSGPNIDVSDACGSVSITSVRYPHIARMLGQRNSSECFRDPALEVTDRDRHRALDFRILWRGNCLRCSWSRCTSARVKKPFTPDLGTLKFRSLTGNLVVLGKVDPQERSRLSLIANNRSVLMLSGRRGFLPGSLVDVVRPSGHFQNVFDRRLSLAAHGRLGAGFVHMNGHNTAVRSNKQVRSSDGFETPDASNLKVLRSDWSQLTNLSLQRRGRFDDGGSIIWLCLQKIL